MQPVSLIVSALAAGASAALQGTAEQAIKDAYGALKSFIVTHFKKRDSVDSLEKKPDSAARRQVVEEELHEANAAANQELLGLARALLTELQRLAPESGRAVGVDLQRVEAEFIKLGDVTSTHIGVQMKEVKTTGGITMGNVKAGSDPERP